MGIPATEGNAVSVLRNGDAIFPAMLEAIEGACRTVDFLTFVYWKSDIGARFAAALSERARHGVRVRVLLDAWGAQSIDKPLLEQMDAAGVHVHWFARSRACRRTRRTTGRTARSSSWTRRWPSPEASASPRSGRATRATSGSGATPTSASGAGRRRIAGGVPRQLGGDRRRPRREDSRPFSRSAAARVHDHPSGARRLDERMERHLDAVPCPSAAGPGAGPHHDGLLRAGRPAERPVDGRGGARRPRGDPAAGTSHRQALRAARRAVVVRAAAGRGVRIWQFQPAMLHAKIMTVDGVVANIGSANLNARSTRSTTRSTSSPWIRNWSRPWTVTSTRTSSGARRSCGDGGDTGPSSSGSWRARRGSCAVRCSRRSLRRISLDGGQ